MTKNCIVIKDGQCITDTSSIFSRLKDGKYSIEIYNNDDKTDNQMRYYRGPLVSCLKEYTGYSASECDAHFKSKFLDVETISINGEQYYVLPSLRNISKVKFARFIDDVVEYLIADLKLNPPLI